ncbi:nicotinate-nucleotide adenylyltransferase [Shewanella surugensis]|uniref:Probable nicotinate-nucleotide adenylyltransferase n=1 Tax=Shewanella surugensis TaxID=212020 RepID=A0ABT0L838_9GAMM|nr:nicotinate-nucleotide adenylyltransferase [Shewanella surugensis]MCL1123815.1 nicotinate-nucleotide adenylyltransferase [Shewanella surugensis]
MHIGILGGTFDPLHFGHIRPAQTVLKTLALDEIWLMPNHIPPHKNSPIVTAQDRLNMVKQTCDTLNQFTLCDLEAKRSTPSYTVISLEQLQLNHPEHNFYFLMGMDSFLSIPKWYHWETLFNLCHLVICQRQNNILSPNESIFTEYTKRLTKNKISQQKSGLIYHVDIEKQPYSSSEIRQQLSQGIMDKSALPAPVYQYIKEHHLYQ